MYEHGLNKPRGFWQTQFGGGVYHMLRDPMGIIGIVLVSVLVFSACFANLLAPYEPAQINVPERLLPPSFDHLLGTDQLGRDVFSRALYGGRIALIVAFVATFVALFVGVVLGLVAGYGPRWLDNIIVLIFDTVRAYPMIILALALGPIFGAGLYTVIGLITATSIPYYGRIVRTSVISAIQSEYVEALHSMGASSPRILFRHLLPNIIGPVLIIASMDIPTVITAEAGLSFLGVGVRPPDTSWGLILDDGYKLIRQTPWLAVAGAVPLIMATLGFTFLGEALRDAFDPKITKD